MRDRALLELLYASGLRVSEACGLRERDLRPDLGIIKCTGKGSRERVVPTSRTCMEAIDAYRQRERPALLNGRDTELLFLSRGGRKLGREVVAAMIRKYKDSDSDDWQYPPAARRSRPANHPGDPRPRERGDNRDLHPH